MLLFCFAWLAPSLFPIAIPTVNIQQSIYTVNLGGTITLACIVTATPSATSVSWTRIVNGITTTVSMASSKYSGSTVSVPSLTIFSSELSDEGSYSCRATNSLGTGQSGSTYLDVIGSELFSPCPDISIRNIQNLERKWTLKHKIDMFFLWYLLY